jgi:hypothetical protein
MIVLCSVTSNLAFSETSSSVSSGYAQVDVVANRIMLADILGELYWDDLSNHQNYGSPGSIDNLRNTYKVAQRVISELEADSTTYGVVVEELSGLSQLLLDPFVDPLKKHFGARESLERSLAELYQVERSKGVVNWNVAKKRLIDAKSRILEIDWANDLFFAGSRLQRIRAHIVGGNEEALSILDKAIKMATVKESDSPSVSPIRRKEIGEKLDQVYLLLVTNP